MRRGKYEKVTAPVFNVAMCLALVLFSLVAVTVYMAQGLYARYVTRDSGSDSARVMKFGQLTLKENDVADAVGQSFTCIPGVNIPKDITVSFTASESDVFVLAVLDATDWEPNGEYAFSKSVTINGVPSEPLVSWAVDDAVWKYLTTSKQTRTYYVYYQLLQTNTSLTDAQFIADGQVNVREATRAEYAAFAGQTMNIDVTAYAVQANGFVAENVEEAAMDAWEAVKN